jgi:hypothetical protein
VNLKRLRALSGQMAIDDAHSRRCSLHAIRYGKIMATTIANLKGRVDILLGRQVHFHIETALGPVESGMLSCAWTAEESAGYRIVSRGIRQEPT